MANIPLKAKFGIQYKDQISRASMFVFNFTELFDKTVAVRVKVSSPDADVNSPILFVVKEQQSVLSWQLPFVAQDKVQYYNVSRTLCNYFEVNMSSGILIEVSTMNTRHVTFYLKAELIALDIRSDVEPRIIGITTSEPMHLRYTFGNETSVMVKVDSEDDHCLFFSVKQIQCPVQDAITNTQLFTGMSQTVSRKGAITVKRGQFVNNTFYIVLALLPVDYDCNGMAKIRRMINNGDNRKKHLQLSVVVNYSNFEQWLAVGAGFTAFLLIYILSIIIIYAYHCTIKIKRNHAIHCCIEDSQQVTSDDDHLISDLHSSDLIGRESHPAVEDDVDLLRDADHDKNVIRSKRHIFVSDLSMKPNKKLIKKYTLYYRNLIPLSIFYVLPVIQLMFNYQSMLELTGNQDICYFNFRCMNPVGALASFNNIFSNIGYVMLGLLFLVLVRFRQKRVAIDRLLDSEFENKGIPNNFGLFYAMGIALVMEGVLSSCYHVCPNYSNFQFDTAYMYVTSCLLMLAIYHKRHPDISPHSHTAYTLMSLVILIEVVGVVNPSFYLWIFVTICHISFTLLLSVQIYYHGRWSFNINMFRRIVLRLRNGELRLSLPMYLDRAILILFSICVNITISSYGIVKRPPFANFLLAIFIINLMMYFGFYTIMKLRNRERINCVPAIYIVLGTLVWGGAFYFYFWESTSWHLTPAKSRNYNHKCIFMNFYDAHDVWHFLSATSLFLSFMTLLTLDDDLYEKRRNKISVF